MAKLVLLLAVAAPVIVNVGPSANGHTIHLAPAGALVIHLQANPSTGYQWQFVRRGAPVLRLRSHVYVAPATKRLGAPGTYRARFTAVKKGVAKVKLVYVRHTSPATPPARTYTLTVAVP